MSGRNQLALVLGAQRKDVWEQALVTPADQGYYKFVEHNYHLSATNSSEREAVETIIALIKNANPSAAERLLPGTTLSIPPIPERTYRVNENVGTRLRVSPSGTRKTVAAESIESLAARPPPPDSQDGDPRDADLTAKELGDSTSIVELAWQNPKHGILPPEVHVFDANGEVRIRLQTSVASCDAEDDWLGSSPFWSKMQLRLQQIVSDESRLAGLRQRASAVPLVIIDWNSDDNHEKKVKSVVDSVLHRLGIELPIVEVDLNPENDRDTLQQLLDEFSTQYYCPKMKMDCDRKRPPELNAARDWLAARHKLTDKIATVNQLVVEAVLWQYFAHRKAWVNMSFSIDSQALEIMQADFLSASTSFGVSAANDDRFPESPVGIPQRAASVFSNFVNVTYGNRSGTLLGGYSNPLSSVIVTAMAQGCGFQFEQIAKTDSGTSFSAPYLTALTWVKFLIDGIDQTGMRKSIIEASGLLQVTKPLPIESGGVFDAARFLCEPSAVIFRGDGSVRDGNDVRIKLRYKKANGDEREDNFTPGDGSAMTFIRTVGQLTVRLRTLSEDAPNIPAASTHDFEVVSGMLTAGNDHWDTDDLGTTITSVVF
jgi:hypothetical protein